MVPQDETTIPWSAISRSSFHLAQRCEQPVLAQVSFLVQQNELDVLFLRNSFLNQQAINQ